MPHSSAGAVEQPQQPFLGAGLDEEESFGVAAAVELASGAALGLEGLLPIIISSFSTSYCSYDNLDLYAEIIKKTESCEATPGAGKLAVKLPRSE